MCWFQRSRGRSHSSRCCCGCMCWLSTPPEFYPQYCCPQTARFLLGLSIKVPFTLQLSQLQDPPRSSPATSSSLFAPKNSFLGNEKLPARVLSFQQDRKYVRLQPVISESIICMSSAMYITDCPADLRSERVNRRLIEKQVLG